MRSLAVLSLAGAVLALVVGCSAGVGDEDVQSQEQTKGQQIEEATKELLGGEIPADEYRD
ncbi:MAG: hypothetical protein IH945_02235 [Armatimonadetes bacterium]|nr:hypothetical protein [Armatimonadota bacterium]